MDYEQGYLDGWLQCQSFIGSMLFGEQTSAAEAYYTSEYCWFKLCNLFDNESERRTKKFITEDYPAFFEDRPHRGIKEKPGWIYVLKADNGMCKIGQTTNLNKRIKQLGIQLPYELEVACTVWTDHVVIAEQILHKHYKEKRAKGEWFALTEENIAEIRAKNPFMVAQRCSGRNHESN